MDDEKEDAVVSAAGPRGSAGRRRRPAPGVRCRGSTPGEPRNAPAGGVHVHPGREGVPPGEPRAVRARAGAAVDADPVAEETRDTVRARRAPAPARPA